MVKLTSKKPGKGTNVPGSKFTMFPTWRTMFGSPLPPPQRIYPGAVISVDDVEDFFTSGSKWFLSKEKMEEYYANLWSNAVPLDPDLVDALLQHWKWLHEIRDRAIDLRDTLGVESLENSQKWFAFCETFSNALDKIYMEALWRKINSKTK